MTTTVTDCSGLALERRAESAGEARSTITAACQGLARDVVDIAQLLTSELITNAITYGSGTIYVEVTRSAKRLRISVDDEGPELPRYPRPGVMGPTGRGLMLVEYLAAGWGVTTRAVGKRVWFELRTA
jgi:anti-sigma regulatory factor (Ser/Thr protein kinase)